jgi:hypothetical protein
VWSIARASNAIHPCNPEIDDFWTAVGIDKDVAGLDVPMHDTLRMAVANGLADCPHDFETFPDPQCPLIAGFHEGLRAGNEFHHVVGHIDDAAAVAASRDDLGDGGMAKSGECLGLPPEPLHSGSSQGRRSHHLHGNGPDWLDLLRLVHAAHSSLGDAPLDPDPTQINADQWIGARFKRIDRQPKICGVF